VEYRKLGHHGLKVSSLSFGAWITFGTQLDLAACKDLIACAYDHGVNFFDNAETYGNGVAEQMMGQALHELGYARDSWCVSSKVFFACHKDPKPTQRGLSRKHIVDACHQALVRLRVDYLDLYLCHRPDPDVPISEIVWTMHQLVQTGKVLYWGTSEWPAREIQAAHDFAKAQGLIGPIVEQPQYNLLHRERVEREYAPLYDPGNVGMGTTVWSPLASGLLSGKYHTAADLRAGGRFALEGMAWLEKFALGDDADKKIAQVELGACKTQMCPA
jgi:aryl-alcohol dehydrogenase-like predicted oxidoreductase